MAKKLPSKKEMIILKIFINNGSKRMYGREIVDHRSDYLSTRSIYMELSRMVEKGYLKDSYSDSEKPDNTRGVPRRYFRITGDGQRAAAEFDAAMQGAY